MAPIRFGDVLGPILSDLAAQRSLRTTLARVLDAARASALADAAAVTTSTRSGELRILTVIGAARPPNPLVALDGTLSGKIVRAGGLILIPDLRAEAGGLAQSLAAQGFRTLAGVRLDSRDRALGTLVVARRRTGRWPVGIAATLVPLARCASVALQHQQLRRYVRSHVLTLLGGRREGTRRAHLSHREREIAELLVEGRSCKEIGGDLAISVRTVQHHVDRMKIRFGRSTLHGLAARLVDAIR